MGAFPETSLYDEKLIPDPQKRSSRRKWCIMGIVVAIIVLIVVIVVPVALLVPKRKSSPPPPDHDGTHVIMPLYIYPEGSDAWNPMFKAIESRPDMHFVVIVNPHNGPGASAEPDDDYQKNIKKLARYANVQNVGYVPTTFAQRNISDVLADIETYSEWSKVDDGLTMQGIFFDEAVYEYDADAVDYMNIASKAVKDADGFTGNKTVIRNPGTIPDSRYTDDNTDIVVIFEETYKTLESRKASVQRAAHDRTASSMMVHSVPDMPKDQLRKLVDELSLMAQYLFVTTNDVDYYNSFASDWQDFIDVVPA